MLIMIISIALKSIKNMNSKQRDSFEPDSQTSHNIIHPDAFKH